MQELPGEGERAPEENSDAHSTTLDETTVYLLGYSNPGDCGYTQPIAGIVDTFADFS